VTVAAHSLRPNHYHRYALPEAAYLADADEARYVAIAPDGDRYLVERGLLGPALAAERPTRTPAAPPERFAVDDLSLAVQRVCLLAATWLDYDEREVEQTRQLFLAR
jgi:hypothetical protein